jgi:hypothetical protein
MICAQHTLTAREGLLKQEDGLAETARRLIGEGEIAAGRQGERVVGTKDPLQFGEVLLVQGNGLN